MSIENQIEAYHDDQAEWERAHRRAKEAVDYADSLGIYAVPCRHHATHKIYWRPRLPNGKDPDFKFAQRQPTHTGWPSWADAIIALAEYLKCEQTQES